MKNGALIAFTVWFFHHGKKIQDSKLLIVSSQPFYHATCHSQATVRLFCLGTSYQCWWQTSENIRILVLQSI